MGLDASEDIMNHVQAVQTRYEQELKRAQAKDAATAALGKLAKSFDPALLSLTTYKGHPIVQFGTDNDGKPFSFGKNKAERICLAIDEYGVDAVVGVLETLAGRK